MKNRIEEILALPYSTFVVPDVTTDNEPCYVAYHPELEGCMSHGSTLEEALQNLREVTELYISALLDKGIEIPFPRGTEITWNVITPTYEVETNILPSITQPIFTTVP